MMGLEDKSPLDTVGVWCDAKETMTLYHSQGSLLFFNNHVIFQYASPANTVNSQG